jgi:hypothetical protein
MKGFKKPLGVMKLFQVTCILVSSGIKFECTPKSTSKLIWVVALVSIEFWKFEKRKIVRGEYLEC